MTRSIARQIEDGEQKSPPERRPKQLELALALTPEKMRAHGLRAAHPRPLVSAGKTADDAPKSWRVPPAKAWRWPAVQYADAGASFAAIALDCDEPQKLAAGLWELPPPSWTIRRRRNENAHVVWCLEEPVHKHRSAKIGPLLYLANTAEYYAQKCGADPGYSGILAHNPAPHFRSDEFETTWGREAPYSLDELASVIPFGWNAPKVRQTGIGRNCDLFRSLMEWAGRREHEGLPVLAAAHAVNAEFSAPLPASEIAATARSVERYRKQWAARGWNAPKWIARQAARGRAAKGKTKAGSQRRSVSTEKTNETLQPWDAEGISRRTWYRRRNAAGSAGSAAAAKPWEAAGVSRATWYRLQAALRAGMDAGRTLRTRETKIGT